MSTTSIQFTESLAADNHSVVRERMFRLEGYDWPSAVLSVLDLLRRERTTGSCSVHLIHGTATVVKVEERHRLDEPSRSKE